MFDRAHLRQLRLAELETLADLLPSAGRILEIGAGTGAQAAALRQRGFDVVAVDLPTSAYSAERIFPVIDYDGRRLPFADGSFDAVFSSNVLEHVADLPVLLDECRRVTASGGIGVHVMPSPAWRFWTLLAGPPTAIAALLDGRLRMAAAALVPLGHGTSHEAFSELWSFRASAWRKRFEASGFELIVERPIGLFHTGHMLLGPRLSMAARRRLARSFGSAARIYVVRVANRSRQGSVSGTGRRPSRST